MAAILASGCFASGSDGSAVGLSSTSVSISPSDVRLLGRLVGSVTDDSMTPIEGANVTLIDLGSSTITDATGRFSFVDLPAGEITIAAAKAGFSGVTRKAFLVEDEEVAV